MTQVPSSPVRLVSEDGVVPPEFAYLKRMNEPALKFPGRREFKVPEYFRVRRFLKPGPDGVMLEHIDPRIKARMPEVEASAKGTFSLLRVLGCSDIKKTERAAELLQAAGGRPISWAAVAYLMATHQSHRIPNCPLRDFMATVMDASDKPLTLLVSWKLGNWGLVERPLETAPTDTTVVIPAL